ncbi:hypothetical protein [Pseudogemmobacter faecipullorum]|uniref:Uncharacterized protein n=1 Tax=Pseudogemmobacter faecipullorum TaxID=2755041 RepID=A0ABS8CQX3_9RHOB|nr:hypothetical protein [Pseudogemmobacter faecipullorum]MCB5411764.1 hypothetical protein [Pseudogemmobacter faecipullorum]
MANNGTNLHMGDVLPALPFWAARSFWLTLLAIVAMVGPQLGLPVAWAGEPETIEGIMQIVGAVSVVLAWRERLAPNYRLRFWGWWQ